MKNRFTHPGNLALLSAFSVSLLFSATYVAHFLFFANHFDLVLFFASNLVLFSFSYLINKYILDRFIYDRIKLIYKSIQTLKLSREQKKERLSHLKGDVISSVNTEVSDWARDKEAEIDQMKQQEAFRREFLGDVSHELKTPIFNIQGYILTLLDGAINDPVVNKDYLRKTEKNIDRMVTIVRELETISHLESGMISLEKTRFDLVILTREVFDFLEPSARSREVSLIISEEIVNPVYVFADREKIRQVLVNLINNSIIYGKERGRTKVSFYDMADIILIEISDNGIGIDSKHLPRLFERFYRVDKSRSRSVGGSGLGLAIVKHILEAHHQTVNVRSTVGTGSTFSFTLMKG